MVFLNVVLECVNEVARRVCPQPLMVEVLTPADELLSKHHSGLHPVINRAERHLFWIIELVTPVPQTCTPGLNTDKLNTRVVP